MTSLCALGGLCVLAGCTTTTTRTTASETPPYDQTTKRVYTQRQMTKTGEQTPAAALEKLDASVTVSGTR